ncbi:MAG: hypothetical protein WCP39_05060, partial [Chlamydiota bacterium]
VIMKPGFGQGKKIDLIIRPLGEKISKEFLQNILNFKELQNLKNQILMLRLTFTNILQVFDEIFADIFESMQELEDCEKIQKILLFIRDDLLSYNMDKFPSSFTPETFFPSEWNIPKLSALVKTDLDYYTQRTTEKEENRKKYRESIQRAHPSFSKAEIDAFIKKEQEDASRLTIAEND